MSDTETAVVDTEADAESIVRVPQNPVELLELQEELKKERVKIVNRIARAEEQLSNTDARLSKVNQRLNEFQATGGGDLSKAASEYVTARAKKLEAEMASLSALRAKFNIS